MRLHQNPGEATRGRLGTARDSANPEAEVQEAVPIGDETTRCSIGLSISD